MAHKELPASIVTKNFMDDAKSIGSKEDYNIYFICDNIRPNSHKFEPTLITSTYNLNLVTVYPPVSIDVNFNQSFNQENLFSKIIEELDIKELSKNGDKFFDEFFDEFFVKVFNKNRDKHIYIFLKKNMEGAAAATSAFYKKKSIKKKSIKKKSIKKKSLKQKKSLKTKKSLKQKKSKKSMKKKNKKF